MPTIVEAGLFPNSPEQQSFIRNKLAASTVLHRGDFTPYGTFEILEKNSSGQIWEVPTPSDAMWSPQLLGLDPRKLKIRTNKVGNIIVIDRNDSLISTIYSPEVRQIDRLGGHRHQFVGASGYLLSREEVVGIEKLDSSAIEELLRQAEAGIAPRVQTRDDRFFAVKVDPSLAGRELVRLDFRFSFADPEWVKDAVVIDPQTYKLVPRRIYHPFAPHRWGDIPREQGVDKLS